MGLAFPRIVTSTSVGDERSRKIAPPMFDEEHSVMNTLLIRGDESSMHIAPPLPGDTIRDVPLASVMPLISVVSPQLSIVMMLKKSGGVPASMMHAAVSPLVLLSLTPAFIWMPASL